MAKAALSHPGPITVDREGRVYVGDLGDEIQVFARDGAFITQWEGDRRRQRIGDGPRAIATDSRNHVYVVASDGLGKFGADGTLLDSWRHRRHTSASDVAIDSRGTIYVAEVHEDGKWSRVRVLSPAGKELATWPSVGQGDDRLTGYMRITVDSVGRVFLVEMWNCRAEVFEPAERFWAGGVHAVSATASSTAPPASRSTRRERCTSRTITTTECRYFRCAR